jgi:hypothetical protein
MWWCFIEINEKKAMAGNSLFKSGIKMLEISRNHL